jgi:lipid II:glycine glycyltransferase (peptidoglycan interpeptide bridge formation enzyme)
LSRVEHSNLLQAWEYGEAKAKSERWDVKRWVYSIGGIDVAISQVLERRVLGIKISRLSRGPLLLNSANVTQVNSVLKAVIHEFSWVKLRILSMSPEIYIGSEARVTEGIAGLWRISTVGADSSFLNLDQDLGKLRINLDSKWRNQLRLSEHSGIRVVCSSKHNDFLWFETIYDLIQKEKEFYGIPGSLFGNIWREFLLTKSAYLFIGEYEGSNIAAVLLVTHGKSATYLAGWNGPKGRKLNANNLLLWEAASQLKSWGFSRFDLGGIDKLHTPTISKFKAGMGGENYKSIGEFIKVW